MVTHLADGPQVDGRALVSLAELRQPVLLDSAVEGNEFLVLGAVIADADDAGIDKLDNARALGLQLSAAVIGHALLDTGAHNRGLAAQQGHSLTHHVRTHQSAVSVVMLQEGDECRSDRSDLLGRNIHELNLVGRNHGEVGVLAGLDTVTHEVALLVQGCITLCDNAVLLVLGSEIDDLVIVQVHLAVLDLAVRSLDEAQVVDLGIHAQR